MTDDLANATDHRKSILSDGDIQRIEAAFDKRIDTLFEMIGYDTSTPKSGEEIRKDHEFVRDARHAKAAVITAILTSVGSGLAWLLYMGAKAAGKTP
jgi:deoxyxylulose-5-phosphate synthase